MNMFLCRKNDKIIFITTCEKNFIKFSSLLTKTNTIYFELYRYITIYYIDRTKTKKKL